MTNTAHSTLACAFESVPSETSYQITSITGDIPDFLRGTYYLNGPARHVFENGQRYNNWLDGDGMVCAIRFSDEGVSVTSRFVQSRKYSLENGEPIFRTFGTSFPGDRLKRGIGTESPYNVSVFPYRDTLLAFGEQSLPMELDPLTLETRTPTKTFDFDGALNDASPFSAHPKFSNGELLNFGVFFNPKRPLLVYYRFNEDGRLACRSRAPISHACSMHDFVVSENYVAFYVSPYVLDTASMITKGASTIEALQWKPELGSELLILSRQSGKECARLKIEGRYCLHTINAFERNGKLVIDLIEFEEPIYNQYQQLPVLFEDVAPGQPTRFEVNVERNQVQRTVTATYDKSPDFPTTRPAEDGTPYEDYWMLGISKSGTTGSKTFDELVHGNWSRPDEFDIWRCPDGQFLGGEPVFVPEIPSSKTGVIVCPLFDAMRHNSEFLVFNASDVSTGPIASLQLREPIHLGFHASFAPDSLHL